MQPCVSCGAPVFPGATDCPKCGHVVGGADASRGGLSTSVKAALSAIVVALAILTAPSWLPIAVYGSLYVMTQAAGGRCGGSKVLHYIKRSSCVEGESPIVTKVVDKPIGDPAECPLLKAVAYSNFEAFTELLAKGAQPAKCDASPDRFFEYLASHCGERPELAERFLVSFGQQRIAHSSPDQLLLTQADARCAPGIRHAVARGANVHVEAADGSAPLHYTTRYADEASIRATTALVALGADPDRPTARLEAPYDVAKRKLQGVGNWPRLESALARKPAE